MTISVPKSLGSSEMVTLDSLQALGDPRKTKLHVPEGGVTMREWLAFAQQLFSTENIRDHNHLFVQTGERYGCGTYNAKFLEKIPADLHKWSFVLSVYGDGYNNESYVEYRSMPLWHANYLFYSPFPSVVARLSDDAYWTELATFLGDVKAFFESQAFLRHLEDKCNANTFTPGNALWWAAGQLKGIAYIRRQTSRDAYRSSTQSLITAPECLLILTEGGRGVSLEYQQPGAWVCICPVSVKNKASLYQVFPHNTNVIDILGGITHKKTVVKRGDKEYSFLEPRMEKQYGVEVELTSDLTVRKMIDLQGDELFFLCKADSSIAGSKSNKYECVTKPMALPEHRVSWARFFANVAADMTSFDQSTQTNNGMHVHISKSLFTAEHLQNMAWFVTNPAHTEFMIMLSQRTADSFNTWSAVPSYRHCKNEIEARKTAVASCSQTRGAFSCGGRSKSTVEIRLFKGIVSAAEIIRNLEAVDAIFEFTRSTPWRQLTLENFYNFVKATPKTQYKFLRADLFKLEMDKLIRKSKISSLVFGLNDPEKIVERINAEKTKRDKIKMGDPFVVDSFLIAVVTRIIGRRCFGQTDDGFLELTQKNRGRIAHLDSRLLSAYAR